MTILLGKRSGQEGYQVGFDADGTRSGSTAAVGRAARLMQIEMHDIEAHIAWSRDA